MDEHVENIEPEDYGNTDMTYWNETSPGEDDALVPDENDIAPTENHAESPYIAAISDQPEKLKAGVAVSEEMNHREAILTGAVIVAKTVTDQYPQVDEEGHLGYYFAGSLATMLLSQAESIEPLDTSVLPSVSPTAHIPVSAEAATALQAMARPIGDIDIALLSEYSEQAIANTPQYDPANPEPYRNAQEKWITNGIKATFPESTKAVIKSAQADSTESRNPARVVVGGQEFYIPDPLAVLEHKAIHLINGYTSYADKRKLVDDFAALAEGLSLIYPPEELERTVHDALTYQGPNLVLPTYDQKFSGNGRTFLENTVKIDENAPYLDLLHTGPERSFGMLNILREYQTPETKEAIVGFINKNQHELDTWQINNNDPSTLQAVANYMRQNPAAFHDVIESQEIDVDHVEEWLDSNSWAITDFGGMIPDGAGLAYEPAQNDYLTLLANLDESHITQELAVLDKMVTIPPVFPGLPKGTEANDIFSSAAGKEPSVRQALFQGINLALTHLEPSEAQRFLGDLNNAALEPANTTGTTPQERFTDIYECFRAFGLPFHPEA